MPCINKTLLCFLLIATSALAIPVSQNTTKNNDECICDINGQKKTFVNAVDAANSATSKTVDDITQCLTNQLHDSISPSPDLLQALNALRRPDDEEDIDVPDVKDTPSTPSIPIADNVHVDDDAIVNLTYDPSMGNIEFPGLNDDAKPTSSVHVDDDVLADDHITPIESKHPDSSVVDLELGGDAPQGDGGVLVDDHPSSAGSNIPHDIIADTEIGDNAPQGSNGSVLPSTSVPVASNDPKSTPSTDDHSATTFAAHEGNGNTSVTAHEDGTTASVDEKDEAAVEPMDCEMVCRPKKAALRRSLAGTPSVYSDKVHSDTLAKGDLLADKAALAVSQPAEKKTHLLTVGSNPKSLADKQPVVGARA